MRAVCSARARSRPSQNSSWAIRASIGGSVLRGRWPAAGGPTVGLLLLLLLSMPAAVADVREPRWAVGSGRARRQLGAAAVIEHPGVLRASALRGVDDHRPLAQRDSGQASGDDPDLLPEHGERAQVDVPGDEPPVLGLGRHGREMDELLGDEALGCLLDQLGLSATLLRTR